MRGVPPPEKPEARRSELDELRERVILLERQLVVTRRELGQSQQKLSLYYDLPLLGMAISSLERRFLDVNDKLCEILGYTREELLHLTWDEVTHPDDRPPGLLKFAQVLHGASDYYAVEKRYIRKDKRIVHVSISGKCVRRQDGTVDYFVVLILDITKSKETEQSLIRAAAELERRVEERTAALEAANDALRKEIVHHKRTEAKFRSVAETVPAIIVVHRGAEFLFVNREVEAITGYSRTELLRMEFYQLCSNSFRDLVKTRSMARLQGESAPDKYEVQIRRKDGEFRWLFLSVALIEYDGERAVLGTGYDITERKLAEAELTRAKQMADAANKAKSEFLANMSHEIRTPIGAVLGFAEMIQQPSTSEAERYSYIDGIQRNGRHLLELVNDILDLSKIEAGQLKIETMRISLGEELGALFSLMERQAQEKHLSIRIECEGPVPQFIHTDSMRLRQILTNIVGNALKFTLRGGVTLTVRYGKDSPDNAVPLLQFIVEDTGIGISEEHQVDLFRPFTQAEHSFSRRFGGTGLGLALARKFARALGGDVCLLKSALRVGNSFQVSIDPGPLEGIAFVSQLTLQSGKLDNQQASRALLANGALKGSTILLVEDGPDNQILFTHFLETAGATVELARDGREGLEMAQQKIYDVILMDIQLPFVNGYEATSLLRGLGYRRPIVALTAHAMKEERERCLEAGCDDCLTKPIDASTLVEQVSHWINRGEPTSSESENQPNANLQRGPSGNPIGQVSLNTVT